MACWKDPGPLALMLETIRVAAVPCGMVSPAKQAVTTKAPRCSVARWNRICLEPVINTVAIAQIIMPSGGGKQEERGQL
jgi:hypothetical protein